MNALKLWRRDGWILTADKREVFPDDPGQGTPLVVEAPNGATGTLLCVMATGVMDEDGRNCIDVPHHITSWLDEIWEEADAWLYRETTP